MSESTLHRSGGSDELLQLAEAFCAGRLDPRGAVRLEEMILSDMRLAQTFVEYTDLHAEVRLRALDEAGVSGLDVKPKPTRSRVWPVRLISAAAMLTVAAACITLTVFWPQKIEPPVARIAGLSSDVKWEYGGFDQGDLLPRGTVLSLDRGWASIETNDGTILALKGPGELSLTAERLARLQHGVVNVRVAESDRGFELHTDDASIVDLGTEFIVQRKAGTGTQIVVEDGRVEGTLLNQAGHPLKALDLTEGRAAVFDRFETSARETPIPLDLEQVGETYRRTFGGVTRIGGVTRLAVVTPPRLEEDVFKTPNHPLLIPERTEIVLEEDLQVEGLSGSVVIPAGKPFDSYLLHYDPPSNTRVPPVGSATFRGTVLGIVTDSAELQTLDAICGEGVFRYSIHDLRGFELDEDRIEASEDGRTVSFHPDFSPPLALDEARILVVREFDH